MSEFVIEPPAEVVRRTPRLLQQNFILFITIYNNEQFYYDKSMDKSKVINGSLRS